MVLECSWEELRVYGVGLGTASRQRITPIGRKVFTIKGNEIAITVTHELSNLGPTP